MWVFIRPRGGQDYYLLIGEIRAPLDVCPIHRFDGMNQIPWLFVTHRLESQNCAKKYFQVRKKSAVLAIEQR